MKRYCVDIDLSLLVDAKTEHEAKQIIKQWKKEGSSNFRIYSCQWERVEGIYEDIESVYSSGDFPD